MNFLRGTEKESRFSKEFVDAIEDFTPRWVESLLPYYYEAKAKGVDYIQLCNVLWLGELEDTMQTYEKDGIWYFYYAGGKNYLALWGEHKNRYPCFMSEFGEAHPEICRNLMDMNWWSFWSYLRRYTNRKPEYDFFDKACDKYLQSLTGDSTAHLTLGNPDYIYFNDAGKNYIFTYTLIN